VTNQTHGESLLVRGARTFPPGPGARAVDVRVRDGLIEAIGAGLEAEGAEVLEADGLTIIPGLVDVHVHFRDPGLEHKEGWDHGSRGALHGGVTSVVEVQNNAPLSISREALSARLEHVRASSRVDFGCLANLLPASEGELEAMAPLTPAFKLFLGGSTGVGGQDDRETLARLFAAATAAGRMIVAHCEDEDLLREGKRSHPAATAAEHHLVRSTEAEVESVRTSIELCRETGAELHVFHLSTGEGARLVAEARAEGLSVSASTAPHYLLLDNERVAELGNIGKVNPSIKTADDAAALVRALSDGVVDAIGTDHAPHPLADKQREYSHAPSGMPSVDLLWPLTWELSRRGVMTPEAALAAVTSRAADTLHLPGKGRLTPGHDGDLVLFDPEERFVVRGAKLPSRSRWSAYEGWELAGPPRVVVRRGEVCLRDGVPTVSAGGRPLRLHPV
jgi:dihydroorotase